MDPATLLAAGGTAGLDIWAAHEQARMIEANAEFQNKISQLNQEMAKIDENEIYKQGQQEQVKLQAEIDQTRDAQTAVLASQGITDTRGSVGDLLKQSELNSQLTSQNIEKQTQMNAARFRQEAQQAALQSRINYASAQDKARAVRISGYVSAVKSASSAAAKGAG